MKVFWVTYESLERRTYYLACRTIVSKLHTYYTTIRQLFIERAIVNTHLLSARTIMNNHFQKPTTGRSDEVQEDGTSVVRETCSF